MTKKENFVFATWLLLTGKKLIQENAIYLPVS